MFVRFFGYPDNIHGDFHFQFKLNFNFITKT